MSSTKIDQKKRNEKLEKWKARSKPANLALNAPVLINTDPLKSETEIQQNPSIKSIQGEMIKFDIASKTYSNLLDCHLVSEYTEVCLESSTLLFQNIQNSKIVIPLIPFKRGSVLMDYCKDSTIVLICPKYSNIQVRLHAMSNCQLYICKNSKDQRQHLIIEDCERCVFHESTRNLIEINDFTNLNLGTEIQNESYTFSDFSIPTQ